MTEEHASSSSSSSSSSIRNSNIGLVVAVVRSTLSTVAVTEDIQHNSCYLASPTRMLTLIIKTLNDNLPVFVVRSFNLMFYVIIIWF
jgi:hypothetical protein